MTYYYFNQDLEVIDQQEFDNDTEAFQYCFNPNTGNDIYA